MQFSFSNSATTEFDTCYSFKFSPFTLSICLAQISQITDIFPSRDYLNMPNLPDNFKSKEEAIRLEKKIKSWKSKKMIGRLINGDLKI
jgi:hypothetical protein